MSDAPKVAICFPAHDHVHTMFAYDLARLVNYTAGTLLPTGHIEGLGINCVTATYVPNSRQDLAEAVLSGEADHILWIDSDMRFPPTALARLLVHNTPIVGINYVHRGVGADYVAVTEMGIDRQTKPLKCATTPHSTGLEEVAGLGFGMVLIQRQVFEALHDPDSEAGPWFQHTWMRDARLNMGEDMFFCRLARQAGFKVYVDHDLSKECRHIGTFEYRLDHKWAVDEEAAQPALVLA